MIGPTRDNGRGNCSFRFAILRRWGGGGVEDAGGEGGDPERWISACTRKRKYRLGACWMCRGGGVLVWAASTREESREKKKVPRRRNRGNGRPVRDVSWAGWEGSGWGTNGGDGSNGDFFLRGPGGLVIGTARNREIGERGGGRPAFGSLEGEMGARLEGSSGRGSWGVH